LVATLPAKKNDVPRNTPQLASKSRPKWRQIEELFDLHSAEAVEFKTEFKTTFRATPARYGTFEDRPRIKELLESLNVPKAPTLLTRWGSAVRVC
jgi:methylphosphotriester-DNA--protein-cysteine methyltransferase